MLDPSSPGQSGPPMTTRSPQPVSREKIQVYILPLLVFTIVPSVNDEPNRFLLMVIEHYNVRACFTILRKWTNWSFLARQESN